MNSLNLKLPNSSTVITMSLSYRGNLFKVIVKLYSVGGEWAGRIICTVNRCNVMQSNKTALQ